MDLTHIKSLIENWTNREPAAGVWLVVVAVIILGMTFLRSPGADQRVWAWVRRLGGSVVRALGYIALLWMFYFLLGSAYTAFNRIYASFTSTGSLSNLAWQQSAAQYGSLFYQEDMSVQQFVAVETREVIQSDNPAATPQYSPAQEVIQSDNPAATPQYRTTQVEQPVAQNSITGFRGQVTINLADLTDSFNGFRLTASYEYDIVNPTDKETRVEYRFPVSVGPSSKDGQVRVSYENIRVRVNGEEISYYQVTPDAITWQDRLGPGEKDVVSVEYKANGSDGYIFYITELREVADFSLMVALNTDACSPSTTPDNGSIQLDAREEPPYKTFTWTIERAIVTPRLSVDVDKQWPYAPYSEMIEGLRYAARALVLCFSLVTMTLLIFSAPFRLGQLALLAGLFAIPHLILMAGGIPLPPSITPGQYPGYQIKLLPVLAILPLLLAFIVLRKRAHLALLPTILVLAIMALFTALYPPVGIIPDEQKRNATEGLVQALMIGYVMVLILFVRVSDAIRARRLARPADL